MERSDVGGSEAGGNQVGGNEVEGKMGVSSGSGFYVYY